MLRELLSRMAAGGALSLASLALELGLGRRELEDMLERLRALGYVELSAPAEACADRSGCAGCRGCVAALGEATRTWGLTARGSRAAHAGAARG